MRLIYGYDSEKYFTKIIEQNLDELTGEYPSVVFGTTQEIPNYNPNLEIPKFVNDVWILENLKESGVFYLKTDATEFSEILKKDANLYTTIEPLQKYNDGTTQVFKDATQAWEYTFKGADLLKIERLEALNLSKQAKLSHLVIDFNKSKKITIQNGNTLIIAHNTPQRKYFLELIEVVSKLSSDDAVEYVQGEFGFRILSEIAAYIFKDLFTATLKNGTKLNARKRNKTTIYNNAVAQINKATTQSELDAITWNFVNPTGILIDVNAKAAEMLRDSTVSDFAKDAINAAKDPTTGEIHLVRTLEELAADS